MFSPSSHCSTSIVTANKLDLLSESVTCRQITKKVSSIFETKYYSTVMQLAVMYVSVDILCSEFFVPSSSPLTRASTLFSHHASHFMLILIVTIPLCQLELGPSMRESLGSQILLVFQHSAWAPPKMSQPLFSQFSFSQRHAWIQK